MNRGGKAESGKRKAETCESRSSSSSPRARPSSSIGGIFGNEGFMVPMRVHKLEVEATHEPSPALNLNLNLNRPDWITITIRRLGLRLGLRIGRPGSRPQFA